MEKQSLKDVPVFIEETERAREPRSRVLKAEETVRRVIQRTRHRHGGRYSDKPGDRHSDRHSD